MRKGGYHMAVPVKLAGHSLHLELALRLSKPQSRVLRPKAGQLDVSRMSCGPSYSWSGHWFRNLRNLRWIRHHVGVTSLTAQ
jgi:hypothetical protein